MNSSVIQSQAAVIKEFIAHPGMKLLEERLNQKLAKRKNDWINAKTKEEAELVRQDARCYAALTSILNEFLLKAQVDKTNGLSTGESL